MGDDHVDGAQRFVVPFGIFDRLVDDVSVKSAGDPEQIALEHRDDLDSRTRPLDERLHASPGDHPLAHLNAVLLARQNVRLRHRAARHEAGDRRHRERRSDRDGGRRVEIRVGEGRSAEREPHTPGGLGETLGRDDLLQHVARHALHRAPILLRGGFANLGHFVLVSHCLLPVVRRASIEGSFGCG